MSTNYYYVSTGAQSGFYTLRHQFEDIVYLEGERRVVHRDWFVRNLATDRDRAVARAEELGYTVDRPEFDLNEIARREHDEVVEASRCFRGGKYEGEDAVATFAADPNYVVWFVRNRASNQRDQYTVEHLLAVEAIREAVEAEIAAEEAADRAKEVARAARAEHLAELADLLADGQRGFRDHVAGDMREGHAPYGRGIDIVCDIIAKQRGRRDSKGYNAEYDRVYAVIKRAEGGDA
jgi:hypothetical protein